MVQARICKDLNTGAYFVSPTVWNWYYVFDRHNRWQILADSLNYLQTQRGLEVHAYVFMLNHIHLIIEADDVIGCLRDFKRHTATQIKRNLAETEPKVLELFTQPSGKFRLWKSDNQPKLLQTEKFALQKLNYIQNNPVMKTYVSKPENWIWSSANLDSPVKISGKW